MHTDLPPRGRAPRGVPGPVLPLGVRTAASPSRLPVRGPCQTQVAQPSLWSRDPAQSPARLPGGLSRCTRV